MAYCEGAPSAQIIIKVEGKRVDLRTSFPPVNYEIKRIYEPGQCPDVSYSIFAWYKNPSSGREERKGVLAVKGKLISCRVTPSRVYSSWQRASGTINNYEHAPPSGTQWNPERGYEILPTFGVPDECGPELGCNLKVWDTQGVLWNGTYDECATVEINCGEVCCPNQQTLVSISGDIQRKLRELQ